MFIVAATQRAFAATVKLGLTVPLRGMNDVS